MIGIHIEGGGPPIVLLHSSMSSKNQWRELIESLRDRYRLIAIDLLGYGESTMPPAGDGYSLYKEVRQVESVLARELRPGERFHLIGHSYGGIVALQMTERAPQRVRTLSLFEPIAFHLLPNGDPDLAELDEVRREIVELLNAGDAHGAAGRFVDYWSGAGAFAQLRPERQSVLAAQVPKILLEFDAVARESRRIAAYRGIQVPTCLVAGRWSPEPAQRLVSLLANVLPHASCVEVAAGHMAPITHPALVNPIFEQFIGAVEASEHVQVAEVSRGAGSFRAAVFGLASLALSLVPFVAVHSVAPDYFAIPPSTIYPLEEGAWQAAPPGMSPGGRFAVISGDPLEPGPFVMRVRLPPGYVLPPYRRRNEEQMIVLAGAITVNERILTSGSYMSLAANELHSVRSQDGAIVQIFGIGPFERLPA